MREATPMPLPQLDPEALEQPGDERVRPPTGQSQERSAPADVPPEKRSGNPEQYPLAWAGKLFFTTAQGVDKVCSGQFISSSVVLTAAHCVQDRETGRYNGNFQFALQYHQGNYSQVYAWNCAATLNGWVTEGYRWDYAMIRVNGQSASGHIGWKYNWQNYGSVAVIGYPVDIASGQIVQVEDGPLKLTENGLVEVRLGDPNFGPGSSGGAWIGDYTTRAQANYVLTVMSHGIRGRPEYSYGPYWDDTFKNLLNYAEGGCR
jgi:V8-like Glu-specific endopeptidase